MLDEPLGAPKGTIRAILVLILLISCALFFYLGVDIPEWYYGLTIIAIGYYFGARTSNSN